MKYLSIFLALMLAFPSYGGGVSRSRAKVVKSYNNNDVVIEQKVIQYDNFSRLQVIAVPVTDLGLQYYYQSEPLRGRNLSEEDRKAIVEDIIAGVLAGIDQRFEIPTGDDGNVGGGNAEDGNVPPPQDDNSSDLDKKVLAMMEKYNCGTCHTEGQLEKPNMPTLLTKDGKLKTLEDPKLERLRRYDIHDSVYSGRMPKNSNVVSDGDAKTFYDWIKEAK